MQNQIPNNWQKVKLGEVAEDVRNLYEPKKTENLSYIGLEHIEQGSLRLNGIGKSSETKSSKKIFKENDILFGTLRSYFRKIVKPKFSGVCSTDIAVIRAKENNDQNFLFYFMANPYFINFASSPGEGTKMPRAKWSYLSETEWFIPKFEEQKRIGLILSSFDDKIELNNKIAKTLEDMASAIFKEFVNNNHSDNTLSLRKIADIVKGKKPKNIFIKKIDNSKEYLLIESFTGNKQFYTNDYKVPQSLEYEPVIVMDGASSGKVFIGKDGFVGSTLAVVKVKQEYLNLKLFILFFIKNIESILISNFTGSAIPHVDRNLLVNYEVPILKNEIIEKFNRLITPVIKKQEIIKKENQKLAQMRDLLLPKLMRGEIRV